MKNISLYGPRLKVERAKHHINQLEKLFQDYIRNNMKRMKPNRNRKPLQQVRPKTFPKHIPTVLGDAIHNLHAALDHAYHIASDANSASFSEYRRFPFGKDRKSLEGSINGYKIKGLTPSDEVIASIVGEIQPYEGGKLGLYGLHDLDITDKHLVLIPTTSAIQIGQLDFVDASGRKTGGGISNLTIVADQNKGAEFFSFGDGGAILKDNPKNAFVISFGEGQPFEGENITDTLNFLYASTTEALNIIGRAAKIAD